MLNIRLAKEFLPLFASGNATEAFKKYSAPEFIHHIPFFEEDAESLIDGMNKNSAKNPNKFLKFFVSPKKKTWSLPTQK